MASILLLEDNYNLLRLYTRLLTQAGHAVEPSISVEAALDVFGQHPFDLIVSDLRLGSFSIERLIRRLKSIRVKEGTPILIMSAHLDTYQQLCIESGLTHLLDKPFDNQVFVDTVNSILAIHDNSGS